MRTAAKCLCVAALVWCAAHGALAATDKPPDDLRPDPRLDQRITLSVAYDSLDEFCARLHRLTVEAEKALPSEEDPAAPSAPVEITCDPAIKEHKVVVRVREQPLREVMRQIAALFDFTWMQGPQEHPRYHLTQSAGREKTAKEMRERYLSERVAQYHRIFRDTVRAVKASPDELREMAKSDPDAVALALTANRIGVLRALDDEAVEALLAGERLTLPFSALPEDVQAAVKERLLRQWLHPELYGPREGPSHTEADWLWGQAQVRYVRDEAEFQWDVNVTVDVPAATPDTTPFRNSPVAFFVPQGLWSRLATGLQRYEDANAEHNERYQRYRSLETDYGINTIRLAQQEDAALVPPWAKESSSAPMPKPSGDMVALTWPGSVSPSRLPLLLRDVAEKLDINLVADCYWTHRDFSRPIEPWSRSRYAPAYPSQVDEKGTCYVDTDADYALYRICEQRCCGASKDGQFYRVRNLLWFVDDAEEVPASVLREWMRRTEGEKHAAPEDYQYLVANLSQDVAANLYRTDYYDESNPQFYLDYARWIGWAPSYGAMKLYSLLPAGLRRLAQETGVDVNTELPQELDAMVERILTEDREYGNQPLIERLTPEQLANLRLWTGGRTHERPIDDVGGRLGVRRHEFCIELWSGGQPTWASEEALGRVFSASYWLKETQDPDKVGKLAEPYATIEKEKEAQKRKGQSP